MPGHRVFIETDRAGTPYFIRRRPSNSSGSYRPTMSDQRIHLLQDEVERLRERERDLIHSYSQAMRQNDLHKFEIQKLQRSLSDQNATIHRLQHENSDLRKDVDGANHSAGRYQSRYREAKTKNDDLERENAGLAATIRDLTHKMHVDTGRKVHELRDQIDELRRSYEAEKKMLGIMRKNLNRQIEDCDVLKAENSTLKRKNDILERSMETAKRLLNRHGLYIP